MINSTLPDNVLGDSLIQSTKINAITISNSNKAVITFRCNNSPVYIKISGNRLATLAFEHDLISELSAGEAWCNFKYYQHFASGVALLAFASGSFLFPASMLLLMGGRSTFLKNSTIAISVTFLVMILIIVVFPDNIVFDLGKGARKRKVSDFILSSIIVAAIVGIVVNVFYKLGIRVVIADICSFGHPSYSIGGSCGLCP